MSDFIKMRNDLSPPADKIRRAGVQPGDVLVSTCGEFRCRVTAIGEQQVMGFWIKVSQDMPPNKRQRLFAFGEKVLQLSLANWITTQRNTKDGKSVDV